MPRAGLRKSHIRLIQEVGWGSVDDLSPISPQLSVVVEVRVQVVTVERVCLPDLDDEREGNESTTQKRLDV
jgi:hypothetical protein